MDKKTFEAQFSHLYHFAPIKNRESIENWGCLLSADLSRTMSQMAASNQKRNGRFLVESSSLSVLLNDQDALKYGHVKDPKSMTESEFVALLDQFCFFWPGDANGPIQMGQNFVNRYQRNNERLFGVALHTSAFLEENHPRRISLSDCNSGAPRSNPNAVIYRGDRTFVPWGNYQKGAATVKEVAILGYARLPNPKFFEPKSEAEQCDAPKTPVDCEF